MNLEIFKYKKGYIYVEDNINDSLLLTFNNSYRCCYYGYTRKEALKEFKKSIRKKDPPKLQINKGHTEKFIKSTKKFFKIK